MLPTREPPRSGLRWLGLPNRMARIAGELTYEVLIRFLRSDLADDGLDGLLVDEGLNTWSGRS